MIKRNLLIFTRTPLHVGAGASVGAIDQPIQRERHTGFPIIPGSSIKGSLADHWNHGLQTNNSGKKVRGSDSEAAWLFGSDDAHQACAGALSIGEARILAFPVRSAQGAYAWITAPLVLQRAARDGVLPVELISAIEEPKDFSAVLAAGNPLALPSHQIVLEEYCLSEAGQLPEALSDHFAALIEDGLWQSVKNRLVLVSNGTFSHFVTTTCEVAQHVSISDETGTAEDGFLFNQENVPADTLFYSALQISGGRGSRGTASASDALEVIKAKVDSTRVFQFGGDASTGHGFCSVFVR